MAEIKSTLELAMERLKKISISEEEKKQMREREVLQKASGLFHRYQDALLSLNELTRELDRVEEPSKDKVKETVLSSLIKALSLKEEDERLLKAIESLEQRDLHEAKERFRGLLSQCRREREKIMEDVKNQSLEALKGEGIYGTAVEPRSLGDPVLKREMDALERRYENFLEEIREQLKT